MSPIKIQSKVDENTPMMRQYQQIKSQHPDAILFFRMGDFYEMFHEDAITASRILGIALTSRNKNKSQPIPMCGVPHHAANSYIGRLIKNGKKVALCEQLEDPKTVKNLVKRDVTRIITPGTILDENLVDPKNHQHLVSLFLDNEGCGLAVLDLTTGKFRVTELLGSNYTKPLVDEIEKLEPSEIILPESARNSGDYIELLNNLPCNLHFQEIWSFTYPNAFQLLKDHFKTHSLDCFGCTSLKRGIPAAGALLKYIQETQKSVLDHITSITTYNNDEYMALDKATIRNMELIKSTGPDHLSSLSSLMDKSCTPMGSRKIKDWILKPLISLENIKYRHEIVDDLLNQPLVRSELRSTLKNILDLERLLGRISLGVGNPRDLVSLKISISFLPGIHKQILQCQDNNSKRYIKEWDQLDDIHNLINKNIVDDPPFSRKEGHFIKPNCNSELDQLKGLCQKGKSWIAALEAQEKERTGINTLKIGYNKIYGYYIEVTKKNLDKVPNNYIRKQSLVNADRFISPELKQREIEINHAEEKIIQIEQAIFRSVRESITLNGKRIQGMSSILSEIDALAAFAEIAHQNHYCKPLITNNTAVLIEAGRHPLIETLGLENHFIANDAILDCDSNQILVITGPNMAGKSTYLRQVALIILMAQIGSFVPANKAEIGIVDRIFTRVGAHDNLLKGQSTFMVEMNETANILHNATNRSLIILDEIGRGTSTFDGISIAWSIVEFLHGPKPIGAKTLFATHYHELIDLESLLPNVKNYNIQVKEWDNKIIFLRKVSNGGADKSYGIQVARLAGIPEPILKRAREVLLNLENNEFDEVGSPKIGHSDAIHNHPTQGQMNLFNNKSNLINRKLQEIDSNNLTPLEAINLVFELKQILKGDDQ